MWHLLAWAESQAIAATDDQLAAVADDVYSRSNNNFQIPVKSNLFWAYAGGTGLNRPRINTPTTRLRGFPFIIPFNTTLLPATDPNLADWRDMPLTLKEEEDLRIDTTNTDVAAQVHAACAGIWEKVPNFNVNMATPRWVRFTSSVTAVANAWSTLGSVTLADVLEGGTYGVYGMQIQGANIIAARLKFQGQDPRPGCLGQALVGSRTHKIFMGYLGLWGQFYTYQSPQIETLESAAGASTPEGYLLVGKIA